MARLPNTAPPATTSARRDVPRSGNTASEPASVATFTMTACAVPSAPWRDSPRSKVQPFAEKLMSSVLGIGATSTQHDDVTVSNRDLAVRATHGRPAAPAVPRPPLALPAAANSLCCPPLLQHLYFQLIRIRYETLHAGQARSTGK